MKFFGQLVRAAVNVGVVTAAFVVVVGLLIGLIQHATVDLEVTQRTKSAAGDSAIATMVFAGVSPFTRALWFGPHVVLSDSVGNVWVETSWRIVRVRVGCPTASRSGA